MKRRDYSEYAHEMSLDYYADDDEYVRNQLAYIEPEIDPSDYGDMRDYYDRGDNE